MIGQAGVGEPSYLLVDKASLFLVLLGASLIVAVGFAFFLTYLNSLHAYNYNVSYNYEYHYTNYSYSNQSVFLSTVLGGVLLIIGVALKLVGDLKWPKERRAYFVGRMSMVVAGVIVIAVFLLSVFLLLDYLPMYNACSSCIESGVPAP